MPFRPTAFAAPVALAAPRPARTRVASPTAPAPKLARRAAVRAVASGEPATAANAAASEIADGPLAHAVPAPDVSQSAIQTLDDVEEIIALVDEFNLYDFRVEDNGVAVEISRRGGRGFEDGKLIRAPATAVAVAPSEVDELSPQHVSVDVREEGDDAVAELVEEKEVEKPPVDAMSDPDTVYDSDFVVTSNRVGFFYSGAKNKPPLVNVRDHVDFNQPVCIIEQLGQQYVYLSEASGTVIKIFVEDGDAVEYDQQVMVIRPD